MKGIIILLISTLLFDILFILLNKSNPQIFSVFNKIPQKWKGKWYIKWIFVVLLLFNLTAIQVFTGLNDLIGYMIAGFILSLCDLIFKKTQEQSKNQKKY